MTVPLNPFRPTRFEQQTNGQQLIWFTDTADKLIGEKSIYVRGSRGSGKTTLLKSICWEDLTQNTSLKLQRSIRNFNHIGVYIRFPDHLSASMPSSMWEAAYPKAEQPFMEFHSFFSLLVELTCVERALEACHSLRILGYLTLSAGREIQLVQEVLKEFPKAGGLDEAPRTFRDLALAFRGLVRAMNESAARGNIVEIVRDLPARQPGELAAFVMERLSSSLTLDTREGRSPPRFKFCLDDCESLSAVQQKSLNTLVRTSRYPISWVVSSVGAFFDSTETFIEPQPLTEADRRVISLDTRSEDEFRNLCQSVVSLRLLFSVSEKTRASNQPDNICDFFSLDEKLGKKDINDFITDMIRKSTSPLAKRLKFVARQLRHAQYQRATRTKTKGPLLSASLPFYETYVLLHWREGGESFKTSFDAADELAVPGFVDRLGEKNFEAWLRRKQRAALLQIAAKLGFKRLPLSGVNVIVSLADGSIRDFLEILGEVFAVYVKRNGLPVGDRESLDRFATSRTLIGKDIQTDGIYAASNAYVAGISTRADRSSDALVQFIDGLGRYTSLLQSAPDDPTVLGRAERGVFAVRFASADRAGLGKALPDHEKAVWNLIRQAEVAGYIRSAEPRTANYDGQGDDDHRGRVTTFRMHRRFSPAYRFSFRGAYEATMLRTADIWLLCDKSRPMDAAVWAEGLAKRGVSVDYNQMSLPLGSENDYA